MNHCKVDRIMEQVARHYLGDFSINDNVALSHRIAQRIKARNNQVFHNLTKDFCVDQMFCSDSCTKEENRISIPKDGVVYGPDFSFEKGHYYAAFYLTGEHPNCQLLVASQKTGIIASVLTTNMEHRADRVYLLNFDIAEKVDDLEFKVINCSNNAVIFERVQVSVTDPTTDTPEIQEYVASEAALPVKIDTSAENMETLLREQGDLMRLVRELGKTASCEIPQNTRFRRIKKMIRKIINSFVFLQVTFNNTVVSLFWVISNKLGHIVEALATLMDHQLWLETRNESILSAHENYSTKMKELEQKLAILENQYYSLASASKASIDQSVASINNVEKDMLQCNRTCSQLAENMLQQNATMTTHNENITRLSNDIHDIWIKIQQTDKEFATIWGHEHSVNADLANLWKTYSSMRRELFYEIESRIKNSSVSTPLDAVAKKEIKASAVEKIIGAGGKVRLNLGSGSLAKEGYLSVDARDLDEVDVVADVSDLPYEHESVDEIYSAHLIEHFTRQKLEKELLPYWYSLLKPGGIFSVVFPDLEAMISAYQNGKMSFDQLGYIIMGAQDYSLDYHYAVYSPDIVISMLKAVGLREISLVARGRENGGCLESEIRAMK